jgi:cytochrome c-type biogenesis protein CcmF
VAPVAAGVVTVTVLFALGMREWYALVSYLLAGFVLGTIVQEFVKGIGARRRMYSEGLFQASTRLIGRNRRRYGGYIVHFGVVVLFCAFAGLSTKGHHRNAQDGANHQSGDSTFDELNRNVVAVTLNITRDGKPMGC